MTVPRRVVAQAATNILTLGVTWLVTRYGIHLDPTMSAEVTGVVGVAGGAIAGAVVKELDPAANAPAPAPAVTANIVAPSTPAIPVAADQINKDVTTILDAYSRIADTDKATQAAIARIAAVAGAQPAAEPAPAPVTA